MRYEPVLNSIHEKLKPRTYLEIGVRGGHSLVLAKCLSVGIDPAFSIVTELRGDVALFRTTSDEYFSRPDPLEPTGGLPFEAAFIDGMHLFEFALRDFIHTERHSSPYAVVVFDDVLPRSVDEAARERHTNSWTGDVYPMLEVLARYRPELSVVPVDTQPTGLLLVMGLDPTSTVLADHYAEIVAEFRRPDPQPVPQELIDRTVVQPPERVLESGIWDLLVAARGAGDEAGFRAALRDRLATDLGSRYAGPG